MSRSDSETEMEKTLLERRSLSLSPPLLARNDDNGDAGFGRRYEGNASNVGH